MRFSSLLLAVAALCLALPVRAEDAVSILRHQEGDVVAFYPSQVQDGALFAVELEVGPGCQKPSLRWLGGTYPLVTLGTRLQALLPVPLGKTSARESVGVKCKKGGTRFDIGIVEGSYPESILSVDPKFNAPAPPRAADEQRAINASFKKSKAERFFTEAFLRPTAGIDTSPFGVRRTYNGRTKGRHRGLDMDGKVGDPILAANDGVVVLAADDYYYIGSAVFIDHGHELFTLYFHMSQVDVKVGDVVKRGQQIGLLGKSGRVTGPHLHFAVKLAGTYVNPADLLRLTPSSPLTESVTPKAPAASAGDVVPPTDR